MKLLKINKTAYINPDHIMSVVENEFGKANVVMGTAQYYCVATDFEFEDFIKILEEFEQPPLLVEIAWPVTVISKGD